MAVIEKCTVKELLEILKSDKHENRVPKNSMDEVFPNVYIGNENAARDIQQLCSRGITHVLNVAKGIRPFQHVNIDPMLYSEKSIGFLGVEATDVMGCRLAQHFENTSDFIENSLSGGGRVLVHCREGVSRSATVVLAFLIARRNFTVKDAVKHVRKSREIFPNTGFLQQLCDLDEENRIKRNSAT